MSRAKAELCFSVQMQAKNPKKPVPDLHGPDGQCPPDAVPQSRASISVERILERHYVFSAKLWNVHFANVKLAGTRSSAQIAGG